VIAGGAEVRARIAVREEPDVAVARRHARDLALREGFAEGRTGAIVIAVSEIARNIVVHAGTGEIWLGVATEGARRAIVVVARDPYPGIADVERAMQDGYSTGGGGLGLGLSSARRLMDEFEVVSAVGEGTTITMKKWDRDAGD
jgi:serine/threonine-protein kinase RsbT